MALKKEISRLLEMEPVIQRLENIVAMAHEESVTLRSLKNKEKREATLTISRLEEKLKDLRLNYIVSSIKNEARFKKQVRIHRDYVAVLDDELAFYNRLMTDEKKLA